MFLCRIGLLLVGWFLHQGLLRFARYEAIRTKIYSSTRVPSAPLHLFFRGEEELVSERGRRGKRESGVIKISKACRPAQTVLEKKKSLVSLVSSTRLKLQMENSVR